MEPLEHIYRREAGRVRATLIRLLGGFELAEEAVHDAFLAAAEQWPSAGVPENPRAWLVSTGRFRAIDRLRRHERYDKMLAELQVGTEQVEAANEDELAIADDMLRLVFVCCHPVLPSESQVALTLREICGLTTEEIAQAFLANPAVIAKRIVRAKQKIRDAQIPYEVPAHAELRERLDSVLAVIYLVFNEGYFASSGTHLIRADLTGEAIRLARLLSELVRDAEVDALLALMVLHHSRHRARIGADGEIVLLSEQDRALWDRSAIDEGMALLARLPLSTAAGPYVIQAHIAAAHACATSANATDWRMIARLYDLLLEQTKSPVVALNRAVAIAECDGAAAGLALIEGICATGKLDDYVPAWAARAEFLQRLGRNAEARDAYERAIECSLQAPERRLLERKLARLG